jgi:hypothetical protein
MTSSKHKSFWLFVLGCLPVRFSFPVIVYNAPKKYFPYIAWVFLIIAVGFIYLYVTNSRMNAFESSSGVTWWAHLRIFHGFLYLLASVFLFQGKRMAWVPLLVDFFLGLWVFLCHKKFITLCCASA